MSYRIYASAFTAGAIDGLNYGKHAMAMRHVAMMFDVQPLTLAGKYDGHREISMVFPVQSEADVHRAAKLFCECLDQQCIMVVDDTGYAAFVDGNNHWQRTGKRLLPTLVEDLPTDFDDDYSYDGEVVWRLQ